MFSFQWIKLQLLQVNMHFPIFGHVASPLSFYSRCFTNAEDSCGTMSADGEWYGGEGWGNELHNSSSTLVRKVEDYHPPSVLRLWRVGIVAKSACYLRYVRRSVRLYQRRLHWTDLNEI